LDLRPLTGVAVGWLCLRQPANLSAYRRYAPLAYLTNWFTALAGLVGCFRGQVRFHGQPSRSFGVILVFGVWGLRVVWGVCDWILAAGLGYWFHVELGCLFLVSFFLFSSLPFLFPFPFF
jgi:hypothetical protein